MQPDLVDILKDIAILEEAAELFVDAAKASCIMSKDKIFPRPMLLERLQEGGDLQAASGYEALIKVLQNEQHGGLVVFSDIFNVKKGHAIQYRQSPYVEAMEKMKVLDEVLSNLSEGAKQKLLEGCSLQQVCDEWLCHMKKHVWTTHMLCKAKQDNNTSVPAYFGAVVVAAEASKQDEMKEQVPCGGPALLSTEQILQDLDAIEGKMSLWCLGTQGPIHRNEKDAKTFSTLHDLVRGINKYFDNWTYSPGSWPSGMQVRCFHFILP
jgi:hypothetical protein